MLQEKIVKSKIKILDISNSKKIESLPILKITDEEALSIAESKEEI